MKSIKWKLVVIYLALVFMVMIVSGTFIILRIKNIEIDTEVAILKAAVEKIEEQIINKYDEKDFQEKLEQQYNRQDSFSSRIQANILGPTGMIIATSTPSSFHAFFKNPDVIKALAGEDSTSYGHTEKSLDGTTKKWINVTHSIINEEISNKDSSVKYVIFVRTDFSSIMDKTTKTTTTIAIAVFLALALGVVIGYIFANTLTGPIIELTKGAKQLAQGNLTKKIEVGSDDEIGQLTETFNYMANELNKTMHTISGEKNKLEIVLKNMTDGILAYDIKGHLIHANPAATEMLEIDEVPDNIFRLSKSFNLDSYIEKFKSNDRELMIEHVINIGEKYIKLNIVPYFSEEEDKAKGVIVVLQDITKQTKLDDMRKEFVANVSHELRTPLTTIKSYSETLLDGAMEQPEIAKDFLNIIDGEADRMALLVTDLLQLSRFDNKQFKLDLKPVMMNEFLKECWRQHKILAEKKHQTYEYISMKKDIELNIDSDRISQVLSNIISNSIKYSPDNSNIVLFTEIEKQHLKIIIEDNGIGIPKEDLPRIFERFYRVDKARSRAMGGTGLGLAISKEIMELHQGNITAESDYGKGTSMILWFPI